MITPAQYEALDRIKSDFERGKFAASAQVRKVYGQFTDEELRDAISGIEITKKYDNGAVAYTIIKTHTEKSVADTVRHCMNVYYKTMAMHG